MEKACSDYMPLCSSHTSTIYRLSLYFRWKTTRFSRVAVQEVGLQKCKSSFRCQNTRSFITHFFYRLCLVSLGHDAPPKALQNLTKHRDETLRAPRHHRNVGSQQYSVSAGLKLSVPVRADMLWHDITEWRESIRFFSLDSIRYIHFDNKK